MISLSRRVGCLVVLATSISFGAENTLNETRSTLDKWVETRQLISKTRSDWQSDKEMLEQSVQLYERELKSVEEQMGKLSTNNTQAEKERVQAETLLKSSNEALDRAKEFAIGFEQKVTKLVPQLPTPLQDILKPSLARMPTNSASTKMATTERIQLAVGILNEMDKFNNAVTIFNEKRTNGKGEEVAVQCVYVGLGAAYFVNDAGDFAGVGSPGANGWEWTPKAELASQVKEVIRMYRNEHPAAFVALPVTIK
jgi:Protein of unknown function (DUF3450)